MRKHLNYFWKNWNESVMFILSIALFFIWPIAYKMLDATAGQFDAGLLHVVPTGFLIVNFILFSAWLNFRMTFPTLHKFFDNQFEGSVLVKRNVTASGYAIGIYALYLIVYTIIFAVIL